MTFAATEIDGAFVISSRYHRDQRGFFARTYCAREFAGAGLTFDVAQANVAFNDAAGTLRGLHYQLSPHAEAKVVRCTRGRVYDVAVDLRRSSPSYLHHVGVVLDANEGNALYVPEGCAHGYLTLDEGTEVAYLVSAFYAPDAEAGVRWDDPLLNISWPVPLRSISEKDAAWPYLETSGADQ